MTLNEFCTRSAGCLVSAFTGHCHMFYVGCVDLRRRTCRCSCPPVGHGLFLDRLEEAGGVSRWEVSTDVRSNSSRRLQERRGRGEEKRFLHDVLLRQRTNVESNIV